MPSVGMIRSTRVFVPKSVAKDVDGTRGFKSSTEKTKLPRRGGGYRDDWFRLLDDSGERPDDSYYKSKIKVVVHELDESLMIDFNEEKTVSSSSVESVNNLLAAPDENSDKMYGNVYSRKRRKLSGERFVSSSQVEDRSSEDRMFGIQFVRKHPRNRSTKSLLTELTNRARTSEISKEEGLELVEDLVPPVGVLEREIFLSFGHESILSFVVESSCGGVCRFTYFLASVLRFMRKSRVRLSLLAAFMSSEPISRVFSLHGIQLLKDPFSKITWKDSISPSGICKIIGTRQLEPIFFVDFLAVPHSFMRLHSCIALRSQYLPNCLVRYLNCLLAKTHEVTTSDQGVSYISAEVDMSGTDSSVKKRMANFIMGASEFSLISPNVKRKRNSRRTGRVKNTLSMDFFSGLLHSDADFFSVAEEVAPESNQKQRKLLSKNLGSNMKELKSSLVELRQNMDVVSCAANILVIESDKCYREEGAKVMLECSASKEWMLMIKSQGLIRYSYKAIDLMRPSTTNRYTHAMIWTGENGWKLEFPDRRDWLIFKELHRECIDRNVRAPPAKPIPVPSVREVPDYETNQYVPFVQPDAYIAVPDDEVARASMRKVANYDVDSGDEEWLEKLNNGHDKENSGLELVSVEKFEEIIDAFEKLAFYCPDNAFDENRAASVCPDLGMNVVGPVYQHWLRKRKQKHGPLLKVFQYGPPKKAQVLNKPVLRKRRSTKRQNQPGRGKLWNVLQDVERKQDDIRRIQEENTRRAQEENMRRVREENMRIAKEGDVRRVEEATESASQSLQLAVLKRNRAQTLMDNADLAAYWATMAVRIAEAAQVAESTELAASFYLD
ncbi:Enhancer of polycomb-like [Macleaya cordata]|uniref:Enhancer of polycomb-like protein n=1 Tax=Macleaya cordata TaxID=56857 RepID=A0A200PZH1_MACCD|nr:Enhancer of polycomb-like [Macleaya cordata]